jgi:hypothetical protein
MAWFSQAELAYKSNPKLPLSIHYPAGTDCKTFPQYSAAPKPIFIINR